MRGARAGGGGRWALALGVQALGAQAGCRCAGSAGQESAVGGARAVGVRRRGRARQARGLGAGRAAWARGLAKDCALGALSLFFARFDSVFFLSQIFGHCS